MSTPTKEPLLVRLPNAVGDVVMTRPALAYLDAEGFSVLALARPFAAPLLYGLPVRHVILPTRLQDFDELRSEGARYAITLRSSFRSTRELRRAGARVIGFRADLRSLLLWRALARPRERHKVEEYHRLAQFADATIAARPKPERWLDPEPPRLPVSPDDRAVAAELLRDHGIRGPFVVCCPTVSLRHPPGQKVWPGFPDLYRWLEEREVPTVTCPGPGEEERAREAGARGHLWSDVRLGPLAALLSRAAAVVSNDTGTLHMGAAVGAPTLGLFGDTGPTRYRPFSESGVALGERGRWPSLGEVTSQVGSWLEADPGTRGTNRDG